MDQDTECVYNNTIFIQTQVSCHIFIVKCMKYLFVASAELGYYYECQRHDNLSQIKILISNLISNSEYIVLPICSKTKFCNYTMNEVTSYPM